MLYCLCRLLLVLLLVLLHRCPCGKKSDKPEASLTILWELRRLRICVKERAEGR